MSEWLQTRRRPSHCAQRCFFSHTGFPQVNPRLRYDTEENMGTFAARCRHVLRLICGAFDGLRIDCAAAEQLGDGMS